MKEQRLEDCPELRLCIILYNDFLCPDSKSLEKELYISTILTEIKPLTSKAAVTKWIHSCTRELKDHEMQNFFQKYLKLKSSSFLLSGHLDSKEACESLSSLYSNCNYNLLSLSYDKKIGGSEMLEDLPLVSKSKTVVDKLTKFVRGVLTDHHMKVWFDKEHLAI